MAIFQNAKLVAITENSYRTPDGVFQLKNPLRYMISFCHGSQVGDLSLQINDYIYPVHPNLIRKKIFEKLGYAIPKETSLYITPCYPTAVIKRWEDELKENNIIVTPSHLSTLVCMRSYHIKSNRIVFRNENMSLYTNEEFHISASSIRLIHSYTKQEWIELVSK